LCFRKNTSGLKGNNKRIGTATAGRSIQMLQWIEGDPEEGPEKPHTMSYQWKTRWDGLYL
jgi:hypothetical protein